MMLLAYCPGRDLTLCYLGFPHHKRVALCRFSPVSPPCKFGQFAGLIPYCDQSSEGGGVVGIRSVSSCILISQSSQSCEPVMKVHSRCSVSLLNLYAGFVSDGLAIIVMRKEWQEGGEGGGGGGGAGLTYRILFSRIKFHIFYRFL